MLLKREIQRFIRAARYAGTQRYCNVCTQESGTFLPFGATNRPNAQCPSCGSLERHRLTIEFLRQKTDLFDGARKRFLHVAPEEAFAKLFADAVGAGYLSADLFEPGVMEKMDITDIQHPDDSFDVIYCSHVLEHVPEDRKAMDEFYRTLKPDGWAILNVPITADATIEDPSVTDPAERERLFGQKDHVRRYGPDYEDRLKAAGFGVEKLSPSNLLSKSECERQGVRLPSSGHIFYCTKE